MFREPEHLITLNVCFKKPLLNILMQYVDIRLLNVCCYSHCHMELVAQFLIIALSAVLLCSRPGVLWL